MCIYIYVHMFTCKYNYLLTDALLGNTLFNTVELYLYTCMYIYTCLNTYINVHTYIWHINVHSYIC